MANLVTDKDFFQGVERRRHVGAKSFLTDEYKDLIRIYFLTEGRKDLKRTTEYFQESMSTIHYVVTHGSTNGAAKGRGKGHKKPGPKPKVITNGTPAKYSGASQKFIEGMLVLVDTLKQELRAEMLERLQS